MVIGFYFCLQVMVIVSGQMYVLDFILYFVKGVVVGDQGWEMFVRGVFVVVFQYKVVVFKCQVVRLKFVDLVVMESYYFVSVFGDWQCDCQVIYLLWVGVQIGYVMVYVQYVVGI